MRSSAACTALFAFVACAGDDRPDVDVVVRDPGGLMASARTPGGGAATVEVRHGSGTTFAEVRADDGHTVAFSRDAKGAVPAAPDLLTPGTACVPHQWDRGGHLWNSREIFASLAAACDLHFGGAEVANMKTTLLILSCALVLASACSKTCEPKPENNYCGRTNPGLVQVHAGGRDCDATLVAGDIVIASSQCVRSAKLADVSVEVEGEVLSAVEIHGDADELAIRVGHAFGSAVQE